VRVRERDMIVGKMSIEEREWALRKTTPAIAAAG
jgi:hypothetical protein